MKTLVICLLCTLLAACATPTPTVGPATRDDAALPRLRSAMPRMPCKKPVWPSEALRRQVKGTVTMKFLIDADGQVLDKAIVRSSGDETLDRAALEATARCRLTVAPKAPNLQQEWVMNQYVWTLD